MTFRELPGLLDDTPLAGVVSLRRELTTARHALMLGDSLSLESARRAVVSRCQAWGGGSHLLIPLPDSDIEGADPWASVLEAVAFDRYEAWELPDEALSQQKRSSAPWFPSVALALSAMERDRESFLPLALFDLESEDPWFIAYLGTFGSLDQAPTPDHLLRFRLRQGLRWDDLLPVAGPESVAGSASDIAQRLHGRNLSPIGLSMVGLGLDRSGGGYRGKALFPNEALLADRVGGSAIVVYEPGSVPDLCALWNLRMMSGFPSGLPLAMPLSENLVDDIRMWELEGVVRDVGWPGGAASRVLCSASVSESVLSSIASELGASWGVAQLTELSRPVGYAASASTDVVVFASGNAQVPARSDGELRRFPGLGDDRLRVDTVLRVRPAELVLPPLRSLEDLPLLNGEYRAGAFVTGALESDRIVELHWPTGWTVLEGHARDRGLTVRRSKAGLAAEGLLRRLGGLAEVSPLVSPEVLALLYRLGERSGMTWFRQRLREVVDRLEAGEDASSRLESLMAEMSAAPDDATRRAVPASEFRSLGTTEQIRRWLSWAERRGVLQRGLEAKCRLCGFERWYSLTEIHSPLACDACAEFQEPFAPDQVHFKYRATTSLLRVLEHDALGHLLVLSWMTSLFRVGFGRPEELYGGHPGVEFLDEHGRIVGESDICLLFSDGTMALGEYKRHPNGLREEELRKLEALAQAVGADWTFVATHGFAANCPAIWIECQRRLPEKPRFALTGDHLFGYPMRTISSDPFEWPDPQAAFEGPPSVGERAGWLDELNHPDVRILDSWKRIP